MTVSEPNFVGSYDIGSHVFFFFRETAVEYINCGKSVYSRVARVCKRDTGGKNILSQNWSTYLKARLNCSIPGEFPFYFNEIRKSNRIKIFKSRFFNNRIFISIIFFFFNISISNFLTSNFGFRKTNECTSIFREYLQGARRWHSLLRYFYHVDERIDGLGDLLVPYRRDSRGVPWKIQRTGDEQQRLASGALQQSSWTAARSMCERHWNVPGHGPQLHSIPSPHGFGDIAREWKTRLL